jgi:hypothetical protein
MPISAVPTLSLPLSPIANARPSLGGQPRERSFPYYQPDFPRLLHRPSPGRLQALVYSGLRHKLPKKPVAAFSRSCFSWRIFSAASSRSAVRSSRDRAVQFPQPAQGRRKPFWELLGRRARPASQELVYCRILTRSDAQSSLDPPGLRVSKQWSVNRIRQA